MDRAVVEAAGRVRLKGELVIDMVVPTITRAIGSPAPAVGALGRINGRRPARRCLVTPPSRFRPRILERSRSFAWRHLGLKPRLQSLPRHGLDARTLSVLRSARDRLGRAAAGAGAHRRRTQHRSRRLPRTGQHHERIVGDGDGGVRVRSDEDLTLAMSLQEGQGRGLRARDTRGKGVKKPRAARDLILTVCRYAGLAMT